MVVRFVKDYEDFKKGWVIGTTERSANKLIALGVAVQVADHIRPLKYADGQAVMEECVMPVNEDIEAASKGAVMSPLSIRQKPG